MMTVGEALAVVIDPCCDRYALCMYFLLRGNVGQK